MGLTGEVDIVQQIPSEYEAVTLSPIEPETPHALVGFRTDRSIEEANSFVEAFGPFLMLTTCAGINPLAAGDILEIKGDPRVNHYVGAFRLPLRDDVVTGLGFTDDVSLLRNVSPDDLCLGIYGGNMLGMTLTSDRIPFSAPGVTDDLAFSEAEIDALCPALRSDARYRSCSPKRQ